MKQVDHTFDFKNIHRETPNRHFFFPKNIWMVNTHMKKCQTSQITREIQIKVQWHGTSDLSEFSCLVAQSCLTFCSPKNYSTPGSSVPHHLPEFAQTHVHWVRGCGENENLKHCWGDCKLVDLQKTIWSFLKKLKVELPYNLAIPLLDIFLEKRKIFWRDTCTSVFFAVLFTMTKIWKQAKYPLVEEWTKKP